MKRFRTRSCSASREAKRIVKAYNSSATLAFEYLWYGPGASPSMRPRLDYERLDHLYTAAQTLRQFDAQVLNKRGEMPAKDVSKSQRVPNRAIPGALQGYSTSSGRV